MIGNKIKKKQSGFTVLFAVLVASLTLAIGAAIFSLTFRELVLSAQVRDSNIAFNAADAGVECALYWDLKYPGFSSSIFGGLDEGNLDENLISHWRFDDGTGSSIAVDSAGSNNGTLINMNPSNDWVSGHVGTYALDFDGNNDRVDLQNQAPPEQFTISAWIRPEASWVDTNPIVFAIRDVADNNPNVHFFMTGTSINKLRFLAVYDVSPGAWDTPVASLEANEWQHVAVTFDTRNVSNNPSIYINSVSQIVTEVVSPSGSFNDDPTTWTIGDKSDSGSSFSGEIDDVRVYSRILTPGDIEDLYNFNLQEFNPPVDQNTTSPASPVCNGANITNPTTGWDALNGWDVDFDGSVATTTFDIDIGNGTCVLVTVVKRDDGSAEFNGRGFNTCDFNNPRRIERGLRVLY